MLFLMRVRIDTSRLRALGEKLRDGTVPESVSKRREACVTVAPGVPTTSADSSLSAS
jgi:hypothetical protein